MHSALGATYRGRLDTSAAFGETDDGFGNVNPTSKLFTVAYNGTIQIGIRLHSLHAGTMFPDYRNLAVIQILHSSVGGYVELGFKPAILIYKCSKNRIFFFWIWRLDDNRYHKMESW